MNHESVLAELKELREENASLREKIKKLDINNIMLNYALSHTEMMLADGATLESAYAELKAQKSRIKGTTRLKG